MKNGRDAFILFGLIRDSNKEKDHIYNMSYSERANEYGIGKIVKGGPLYRGNEINQEINREFEMRIHLKNKFVRVSDYPNYSSVCELDD